MDSVFVITQNPPKTLSDKEMVLSPPTFIDEVKACARKKGSSATVGPNYLRSIAEEIGRRYDKFFNPYRNIVPHDFAGRICESDEDVARTVHEMFQARYPAIYQRYYESILRSRPFTTKVIYFSGEVEDATVFQKLGIPLISLDDVPAHLGIEKPAAVKSAPQAPKPEALKPVDIPALALPENKVEIVTSPVAPETNSSLLEELATLTTPVLAEEAPKSEPAKTEIIKPHARTPQTAKNPSKPQHAKVVQPIKTSDV